METRARTRTETGDREGAGLRYAECGSGPPLLLIHPAGSNADTWGDLLGELARSRRVIVYDRRGYSPSARHPATSIRQHAEDAAALLGQLGAAPAVVVGLSVGATIALELAVQRSDLVSALILHEPPFHAKKHPDLSTIGPLLRVQTLRLLRRERRAAEAFLRWAYAYRDGGSAFDAFPAAWRQAALDHAGLVLRDLDIATGEHLTRARLAAITCPAVCSFGERGSPAIAKLVRGLAAMLPQAELVGVPGAGHAVHFDQPQAFAELISERTAARR